MRSVGIDLSANPAKTAMCAIDWDPFDIALFPRPVTDDEIVAAVAGSDVAGIDVPLGWPDRFVEAVVAHHAHDPWPVADLTPPDDREPLRFRLTDVLVAASGSRPLSVSTDRIGVAAMRWARLEHQLVAAGVEVDRSGTSGRVCETYPAGTLRRWGLTHTGYKTKANDAARRGLVDALAAGCGARGPLVHEALTDRDDDDLDAFVCALAAHEVAAGRSNAPDPDQLALARREGWIHLPTDGLASVAGR